MRLFVFGILVILLQGSQCLYFKKYQYKFCPSSEAGQVLVDSSACDSNSLRFSVSNDILTIDNGGRISVKSDNQGLSNVKVEATCTENGEVFNTSAIVDIIQTCDLTKIPTLEKRQELFCFDGSDMNFTIFENIAPISLGKLSAFSGIASGFIRDYFVINDRAPNTDSTAAYFNINPTTSSIALLLPLDAEPKNVTTFKITCRVSHDKSVRNISATLTINVQDQNDNPPIFANGSQINSVLMTDEKQKVVSVQDKDRGDCSKFAVEVFDDPLNICHPIPAFGWFLDEMGFSICRLAVDIVKSKVPLPDVYTCNVAFIDTGYLLPSNDARSDRVILELRWIKNPNTSKEAHRENNRLQLRVNRNAGKLTQIYRFPKNSSIKHVMEIPRHGFGVTLDGIVYVENIDVLRKSDKVIKTTVNLFPGHTKTDLFISIIGQSDDPICNISCSRLMNKSSCETKCGLGTMAGHCVWRQGSGVGIVSKYTTCSPNLVTCPNNVCDSLELAYPALCPQDCTQTIKGTGQINKVSGRGILRGLSQCWCDYNQDCYCFDKYTIRSTTPSDALHYGNQSHVGNNNGKDKNRTVTNVHVDPVLDEQFNNNEDSMCDIDCKITIATICGCICALGCLFVVVWKTRRFKCHRNKSLKHVGSTASMSVIPSDYFDDRDYRTTHSSPQYGPYYKESFNGSVSPEDAKWEIDREHLQLDNTLGEGEFGKVVKAKAFNIDGKQTYTDVAVKMLKNCASSVEQQALWSEFNLLKDVQHPNVIRLLGACTLHGPTFVIVEYCEHGSLLCYLRNSRLEENGYVNQRYKPSRHLSNQQREPPELLTIRDLLSFAWQTAKGMQYLSEIKLVHRDLAARNILVGSGKVLKISDFGLTRDVYEADTYLKQSKGRIPVKWLAPESLYAQIYTTQSDVWSFGIVLWEIVTLGAPPYPGVPPERLYNLLLAGYRMDRPENCSDELYAVMQKCWKTDPQDRPTFSKLAEIFDRMLQQRTEYLELTGGFDDDTSDLFGSRYAPSVSGISVIGRKPLQEHSENTLIGSRNSCSSYLTPALTNTVDSNSCLSDVTSSKREPSNMSEMSSLLSDSGGGKNPFVNETMVKSKAEQTVV